MRAGSGVSVRSGFGVLGCLGIVAGVFVLLFISLAISAYFLFDRLVMPTMEVMMASQEICKGLLVNIDDDAFDAAREKLTPAGQDVWTTEKLTDLKKELDESVGNYRQAYPIPANVENMGFEMQKGIFEKPEEITDYPVRVGADYKNGAVRYDLSLKKVGEEWLIDSIEYKLFPGKHLMASREGEEPSDTWGEIMGFEDDKKADDQPAEEPSADAEPAVQEVEEKPAPTTEPSTEPAAVEP